MTQKTAEPMLHAAHGIWGNPLHLVGYFPDTDPVGTPENLGIHCQCHKELDIMCTYNSSVDLGRQMVPLAEEEFLLWVPGLPSW